MGWVAGALAKVRGGCPPPAEEVFDELGREAAEPRPEPARWAKIAR